MFKIPLVPHWNLNNGCVCTPDGGFLYIGFRTINFISSVNNGDGNEAPEIKCFNTRQGILSLDIDPHWGQNDINCVTVASTSNTNENEVKTLALTNKQEEPAKLFAALLQDNSVQIWDFNKGCAVLGHQAHLAYMRYMEGNGPSPQNTGDVLISYMCNRNVLSVDSQDIVVYCVASNSFYRRPMFVSPRNHQITSMKCSPYNENLFAIGTKKGLVLLCDLQKMTTLYTLRGHSASIKSFAWTRIPLINKAPDCDKPKEIKKQQSKPLKFTRSDADEIFDIYDYDYLDNEFGAPSQEVKPKTEFADFVGLEKPKESCTTTKFDFAEACQSLKEEINALRDEQPHVSSKHIVSLEDCKLAAAKNRDDLSSCGSDGDDDKESSNESIVRLMCRTPSSEDSLDIDGMHPKKQHNIICQVDVHSCQLQATEKLKSKDTVESEINDEDVEIIEHNKSNLFSDDSAKSSTNNEVYDFLLASSSTDGTFCVWNASTGATCDTHKIRSHTGKNTHIEICWISSDSLIILNKSNELQMWRMQPLTKNITQQCAFRTYKFKEIKRCWPQRSVVCFACSPKHQFLWCISSNRELSMENLNLNKLILNYSCVPTNIGAMQECPDDMNKIALGFSDHRIGIIDISKITSTSVHIKNFVHRVESYVMSLKWSPDCKKLAYGTSEGRIGIINEESSKTNITFNPICGKPIYSISWQDKFLYVVCNDRIAVYEDDTNNKDPYVLPNIENVACISLSGNYLFVGYQNGSLGLYSRVNNTYFQYEFNKSLDLAPRYISKIAWSPIATNKLAVVANANIIQIIEFNHETADLKIIKKIEINANKAANSWVKWSNRNENLFLTCGFDGAVRVWDLSNEKNPERFVKTYHCPMTCGIFLPNDEDIIICSGKTAGLELIDMRVEQNENSTVKSKRSSSRTLDTVQWATKALTCNDPKSQSVNKKLNRRLAKTLENNLQTVEDKMVSNIKVENDCTNSEEVSTMLEQLHLQKTETQINKTSIYMKNPLTLLYLTTKEINKDALDLMFTMLSSSKANEIKSLSAKLYGTKAEAKEVLAAELKNHQSSEIRGISSLFMSQLNGNFKEEIIKCVQSKELSEWHVSLAPSISFSFWQKCCQAYAEQLIEEGYALQGAVYLLAIHKHSTAIEMLIEKKFFKEALLIARIYLQAEDPIMNTISEHWIKDLYTHGNLTGAALLCLLTKQNTRAYECLAKIRNTSPEIERVIRLLKSSDIEC